MKIGGIMAIRPVFVVSQKDKLICKENIDFEYFNGFSVKQKKRCIDSLHKSFLKKYPKSNILEISSKSENILGINLSAFNLTINTKSGKIYSVESAFQASKVFENGGPYIDLLNVSSRESKRDERLKTSGNLIKFSIDGKDFPLYPKTYFYNWLYINTLALHPELTSEIIKYNAFTDIEFNPKKSINCQAESASIYVSLFNRGLLNKALESKKSFLNIVYSVNEIKKENNKNIEQLKIF